LNNATEPPRQPRSQVLLPAAGQWPRSTRTAPGRDHGVHTGSCSRKHPAAPEPGGRPDRV